MSVKTRFAPSPTGMLHVGNVRTALINWLFTRSNNGIFMLRMDDTDLMRSKPEYAEAIKKDLQWLGINWDELACQSERLDRYNQVKKDLISSGRLYPCYETQDELDMKRKMLLNRGLPPIYDRLNRMSAEEAKGRAPHYRFLLNDEEISWNDCIRGDIEFQAKNLSDPIVVRENGSMTYILCSAIDDIDFGITHVFRGEDHITNTAIGIQITKAIGFESPIMGHLSLLQSKTGEISKRIGGYDISSLRNKSIESMAINSLLAKMGSSDATEVAGSMQKLIDEFDTSKFSHSAVNYDFNELLQLNHKLISNMTYEEAKASLNKLDVKINEAFWMAVHGNINTMNEVEDWWKICYEDIIVEADDIDKEFLKKISNLLPLEPWDLSTWSKWIEKIKKETGRNGKQLFMPIRFALTGKKHGPELNMLLPHIGIERTRKRLDA